MRSYPVVILELGRWYFEMSHKEGNVAAMSDCIEIIAFAYEKSGFKVFQDVKAVANNLKHVKG